MVLRQLNVNGKWTKRSSNIELHPLYETHRKILKREIVFDIDTHDRFERQLIEGTISNRLSVDKYCHSVWDTSRSTHIHLYIDELALYPKEARNLIRRLFIKKYAEDFLQFMDMNKSEDTVIRDFNSTHNKTKGKKTLVYEEKFNTINTIPFEIKNSVEFMFNNKPIQVDLNKHDINSDLLLNYVLKNRIDKDGLRNSVLFKNIAIMAYNSSLTEAQAVILFKQVAGNCKGKKWNELHGWYKWCQRKGKASINKVELNRFIKVHGLNINLYG